MERLQIDEKQFDKILALLGHEGIIKLAQGIWQVAWYVRLTKNLEINSGVIEHMHSFLSERIKILAQNIDCYPQPITLSESLKLINDFFDGEVENCKKKKSSAIDFINGILELLKT
ncbi:MAG TPA: hypothetical protein EYG91_06695 [Aquifex aeolicus]|nr:hypothetical protein [Aquifex aeolicus]